MNLWNYRSRDPNGYANCNTPLKYWRVIGIQNLIKVALA